MVNMCDIVFYLDDYSQTVRAVALLLQRHQMLLYLTMGGACIRIPLKE